MNQIIEGIIERYAKGEETSKFEVALLISYIRDLEELKEKIDEFMKSTKEQ